LTEEDRSIVRALQNSLPIVDRPFAMLADVAGITQEALIERARTWQADGTIRRFGARINHKRLGFDSNVMAVWSVQHIDEIAHRFVELPEISHCYRREPHRDWPHELYTMVHARDEASCREIAEQISQKTGVTDYAILFSRKELKKTSMRYFQDEE